MFEKAIDEATQFTRAVHHISRNYGSQDIQPGCSTLFFVNRDGWALTCGHVIDVIVAAEPIAKRKSDFCSEIKARPSKMQPGRWKNQLEKKYNLNRNETYELLNMFMNCFDACSAVNFYKHAKYDIGLLKFDGVQNLKVTKFPTFPKDTSSLKSGRYLCRIGFPFPEFQNFEYEKSTDTIKWTSNPHNMSPWFPLDGMVTRFLNDGGNIFGFEMSTPGIKGQSGGPIFDSEGKVWGMQYQTAHHDLDFDVEDMPVFRKGLKKKISSHSMLNVGLGIHVNELKEFMRSKGVSYNED